MTQGKRNRQIALITILTLIWANISFAQTVVKGFVKDATTMKPLSFVSIYFEGGKGVVSGENGNYSIETQKENLTTLVFSYTGYKTVVKKVTPLQQQTFNIELGASRAIGRGKS